MYGVVTWPTLGHHTKLPLDGRRNETNILIYNILSRKQGSNPTTLKLKTMRWDEAPICHRKLKNIHSQALTPLLSNVVSFTFRYNSPVTIMTSYIRSKSQHHSFCFPISKNRRFSGLNRGCLNDVVKEKNYLPLPQIEPWTLHSVNYTLPHICENRFLIRNPPTSTHCLCCAVANFP